MAAGSEPRLGGTTVTDEPIAASTTTTIGTTTSADAPRLREPGPTALRMLVGARLRRLREAAGLTRENAATAIRSSHSKISRMELGRHAFKTRDVTDLLALYGAPADERVALLAMAEQAGAPGWWHAYGDAVPPWFESYLGMEQSASVIRTYEVQFVPGLLQIPGYARAVVRLDEELTVQEVERRVAVRMRRAQILHRGDGAPRLWAVIDEGALRRPVCGPATMRAQLDHLIEMSRPAHVNVQVLPFSAGGHPAGGGPISILRFPQDELPDLVYLEQLASARYPVNKDELTRYQHIMDRLVVQAAPPDDSLALLHRIRAGL